MTKNALDLLQTELYESEILRVNILIGVYIIAALTFVFISIVYRTEIAHALGGEDQFLYIYIFTISIVLYQVIIKVYFKYIRKNGKEITPRIQYINAFEESLIPTVALVISLNRIEPFFALNSPTIFLYFIFIVLSILRLNWKLSLFTGISSSVQFMLISLYIYSISDRSDLPIFMQLEIPIYIKALFMLLSGVAAGFVANEIHKRTLITLKTLEDRNHILEVFGQHVSPEVALELLSSKVELKSKRANVCVMFLDIRGFTHFSEQRQPEEVVQYLNELFEVTIEIVNKHNGIIHQLLGDGFMAVFGAPIPSDAHCQNGVNASLEIIEKLKEYDYMGYKTTVGIGLHAGEALTGTVGSKLHKEYKITGDVVNLASRIEQLNKEYKSQLLISDDVWENLPSQTYIQQFQNISIRGREKAVTLYQLA